MQPTRRHVLLAGAVGVVSACTPRRTMSPPPVDPDVALIAAAVAHEQSLIRAYDDVLAAHPELAARLAAVREEHAQHVARLQLVRASNPPTAPTTPPPTSPSSPVTQLAALAVLERSGAAAHGNAALTASRRLAPVLASLSASEASHAVVL